MNNDGMKISGEGLTAVILPYGARLADVRLAGSNDPLILRYNDLGDFLSDKLFMGAVIGRYSNRIQNGRVVINGEKYELDKNEENCRHLHGGAAGSWSKNWEVKNWTDDCVQLSLFSPDGEAGYPGNLTIMATYSIPQPGTLRLDLEAHTDKETIVNLCHHPYFNLDNKAELSGHRLTIKAASYLPSGADLVPTGEIRAVDDSIFDFRTAGPLTTDSGASIGLFNNTYCLTQAQQGPLSHAATLTGSRVEMQLWTTQPGLHLYNGYKLNGSATGFNKQKLGAFSGVCLEAQGWPDSPNQPDFPSCLLAEGSTCFQRTEYRFSELEQVATAVMRAEP